MDFFITYKLWFDRRSAETVYQTICNAPGPVIRGQEVEVFPDQPLPRAIKLGKNENADMVGIVFVLKDVSFLNTQESMVSDLRDIGEQFCRWVLDAVGSSHQAVGDGVASDASSEDQDEPANSWRALAAQAEIDSDPRFSTLDEKNRLVLTKARIGQGQYRKKMLELWDRRCAVTGAGITEALVASHAIAWSDCSIDQCVDPYNGLLLCGSLDRLFDEELIAFANNGKILKSKTVSWKQLELLGAKRGSRLRKVLDRHKPYLEAHRRRSGFQA